MTGAEVRPALVSDEWARAQCARDGVCMLARDGVLDIVEIEEPHDQTFVTGDGLASAVALANAALPDGHPNKLTHEDAAALRAARDFCRSRHMRGHPSLDTLPDKLAALLPPTPAVAGGAEGEGRADANDSPVTES